MNLASDESKAILFKSISLIERVIDRLERVDESQFPTLSSTHARKLFVDVLKDIRKPANLEPVVPAVLHRNLLPLQDLADTICRSSTDYISCPLVSYCDDIWRQIFNSNGPDLFYSLTTEYNYSIRSFSKHICRHLIGVLAEPQTKGLINGREMYCLELPSSEDANLPLYANIGHEFGHAVFNHRRGEILPILADKTEPLRKVISESKSGGLGGRHFLAVLNKLGTELFCDIVGAHLMGPAFLLSLFEMSWGKDDKSKWIVKLSPDANLTVAYPSYPFRLDLIRRWLDVGSFCSEAEREFAKLKESTRELANALNDLPVDHRADTACVVSSSNKDANISKDAAIVQGLLGTHLDELKQALTDFVTECGTLVKQWWPDIAPMADATKVASLLLRLQHNILPNIEPDGSLLGTRASFPTILLASALHRLHLLTQEDPKADTDEAAKRSQQIGITERLTAKALEVTYVQCEYSKWSGDKADERTE